MDSLSAHKVAAVRQAIESMDAKIAHLPTCSPNLNPIEQLFAKGKLRSEAELCSLALYAVPRSSADHFID